SIYVGNLSYD
nr:RecName: Full=Putative RNA-binding protein RbpA [Anabaena sp. L-31]